MNLLEEGRLLAGLPLEINSYLSAVPRTMKEILNIGLTVYHQYGEIIVNTKNFIKDMPLEVEELNILVYIMSLEFQEGKESDFSKLIIEALSFFTKEFFYFDPTLGLVYGGKEKVLTNEDYLKIRKAVKLQYNIEERTVEPTSTEEESEDLRKAREKLERNRKEVAKLKEKNNQQNVFLKYLSRFATVNPNANLHEILDYTLYQFDIQFSDFLLVEDSERTLRNLLAGGDPKKVKYVHWTKK